jgi:hypothetical protein
LIYFYIRIRIQSLKKKDIGNGMKTKTVCLCRTGGKKNSTII